MHKTTLTALLLSTGIESDSVNTSYERYFSQEGSRQEVEYFPTLKPIEDNPAKVNVYGNKAIWTKVLRTSYDVREHPRHQLSDTIAVNYDLNLIRFGVNVEDVVETYQLEEVVMYRLDLSEIRPDAYLNNSGDSDENNLGRSQSSYDEINLIDPENLIQEQILWSNLAQRETFLYGEVLDTRVEPVKVQVRIETGINFSSLVESDNGFVTFEYLAEYPVIFTPNRGSISNKVDLSWLEESCRSKVLDEIVSQAEEVDMEIYARTRLSDPSDYLTELDDQPYHISVFIGPNMNEVKEICEGDEDKKIVKEY